MSVVSRDKVMAVLMDYIQDRLLDGDQSVGLTTETPLLEWGILNSIETARLVSHIRTEFGVRVPPSRMVSKHFGSVEAIADLIGSLQEARA